MSPLHHDLDVVADVVGRPELPAHVAAGLAPALQMRPYQRDALTNFVLYLTHERFRRRPGHVLFHMATGSGKTYVMAALMLYLYGEGHRNFLFFVNSTNVLGKTRDNLLDPTSPKYLFTERVEIGGERVEIREVANFQEAHPDRLNICFTTIQGLHSNLGAPREGSITFDDFAERPLVLISDEAHHLNALTRARSSGEQELESTWESTVSRVLSAHRENLLLEFTATCDLANAAIAAKYDDKIVADYPLARFRQDRYSKEIRLYQSDSAPEDRALQAMVLSQYRLKLFQQHGVRAKPVVLLKSRRITESREFHRTMLDLLDALDGARLEAALVPDDGPVDAARRWFDAHGVTLDALAAELRDDFGEEHSLWIAGKAVPPEDQVVLNTLESPSNPIRAVYAVDMLDEGWDVLNLYDIVRLYETRAAASGRPAATTLREAQLIGRGARYYPFDAGGHERGRRKFDDDLGHELRICEELYFHSRTDTPYIEELRTALRATGALPDAATEVTYELKESFRDTQLYREGWVFLNERRTEARGSGGFPADAKVQRIEVRARSRAARAATAFAAGADAPAPTGDGALRTTTRRLDELPLPVLLTAARRNQAYRFDRLKARFPALTSSRELLTSDEYLGGVTVALTCPEPGPDREQWLHACDEALAAIAPLLEASTEARTGTREFRAHRFHEVFTDRTCYVENPTGDGVGTPQRDAAPDLRLDLATRDWFAYHENYGTTEEKRFVRYFDTVAADLAAAHGAVHLVRNEGQAAIYAFADGRRFEPDYLLFLGPATGGGDDERAAPVQYQVFVEPKGEHLLATDRWKQDLLLQLEGEASAVKRFVDDTEYRVWGLPFHTASNAQQLRAFTDAVDALGRPR